jgi:hypothetical protein
MGMTAKPGVRLQQRHPVTARQHVCGGEPGYATPDDGDRASETIFAFHDLYSEPFGSWIGVGPVARR